MKNILFDLKISSFFSGAVEYEYQNYINNQTVVYRFGYQEGVLVMASAYDKNNEENYKILNPIKFNGDFWKKAPKYANFDNGSWTRTGIQTHLDLIGDGMFTTLEV